MIASVKGSDRQAGSRKAAKVIWGHKTFPLLIACVLLITLVLAPPNVAVGQTLAPARQEEQPPASVPEVALPEGTINVALLGVDKRPTRNFANTDVIIIASINPDVPSVVMLSIPRDTPAYIPGYGTAKVNTAFAAGGPDLFKSTLLYNFGLRVDYYAMVNFEAVVDAVDTLGGIDVVSTCPLYHVFPRDPYYMGPSVVSSDYTDTFTGEVWKSGTRIPTLTIDIPKPGVYTLDGLQALAYIRARKGIPGGDVDRGRREQRVVRALFAKAKQVDILSRIPALFDQFQHNVQTDMPLETVLYFASIADRFNTAIIRSRFLDYGGANGAVDSSGPLALPSTADRHNYLQSILTVALNQRPNDGIPIEVWNGTADPGFGAAAADRLTELGFRIVDLRAADQIYDHTVIYDYNTTRKGSAVSLLLRTFDLPEESVVAEPQADGARYRIIVGPDFNTCYYASSAETAGNAEITSADAGQVDTPAAPIVIAEAPIAPIEVVTLTADLPTDVQVTAGNLINVRSGPSTEYRAIGSLGDGEVAPVLGKSLDDLWWHIRYRGKLGWVSAEYARPVGATETVAEAEPPLPAEVSVSRGDMVNVRDGPGVDYSILGRMVGGERANILGKSDDDQWWQIDYAGQTGWISARYVSAIGDVRSVPTVN